MPRHEDLTANVQRTPEEQLRIYYSLAEIDTVIDGYPQLDNRLYIPTHKRIPVRRSVLLGREVNIYTLPGGHDATNSSYRQETLARIPPGDMLLGEPDPDLPTGGNWELPEEHPAIRRALRDRCRDFTQHLQPLVPGWRELLALQTPEGRGLGMPTGIGWYTHLWLSEMCDGVTMRLSPAGDDIEVLLYKRPGDEQSKAVWATPGGFAIKADTQVPGVTPLQAASARRTKHWTDRDVARYAGLPLRVKYPISSGNTLVAGLKTTPYARFITKPDYTEEPTITEATAANQHTQQMAGFVSLHALCEYNPTGGVSGSHRGNNPFPIWTTHFEYVTAGLEAIADPENQYRFNIRGRQFSLIRGVVDHLQSRHPQLQAT